MKKIPVSSLKEIAKKHGLSHVCVYGYCEKENAQYVSTYGVTKLGCDQIAQFGDKVKLAAGWPEKMVGQLPSRIDKYRKEAEEMRKENALLKAELEKYDFRFLVDIYESERGWGKSLLRIEKFKTKEQAIEFAKKYNLKNTDSVTPDYYTYADIPREIKFS